VRDEQSAKIWQTARPTKYMKFHALPCSPGEICFIILCSMVADITVTEKSFGLKSLMNAVRFSIDDGEKIGIVGRNGVGKSTLFGILAGTDKDFAGEIIYRRGSVVVATKQEHHNLGDQTVLQYILHGLPEYTHLSHIVETYPQTMGENMRKITEYTESLQRFDDLGYYQIEEQIERELDNFQLPAVAHRPFASLSGGQKRLVEVVKIMHSQAHLALVDEPTNHMDYVAKAQFIDWLKDAREAVLVITHDRDVLREVDRIIEIKDGKSVSYPGNYDAYLAQNALRTNTQLHDYETMQRQIVNLKKQIQSARAKKASWGGTADKKNPFVVIENKLTKELKELETQERPSFWIDKQSVEQLDYKAGERYEKYKTKNIRMHGLHDSTSRSKRVLFKAVDVALGYGDEPLFTGLSTELRENECLELRGRNGAGKTTFIKALLARAEGKTPDTLKAGDLEVDPHATIGIYEQEVSPTYFDLPLGAAIERLYLDRNQSISQQKIMQLMSDYLFDPIADAAIPIVRLSGGQKARFQLISMLASNPQLLILDEPTNHLDLPSIEELENALKKYSGAILYVSHDGYFRDAMGGAVVHVGKE
jgi:ATP-binding cassette, subfamily F, member 3